jgi:Tol biopolymer transport system component
MHYALSSTGTLVYVPGTAGALRHNLVKIDHDGAVTRYPVPERQYYYPRISPDARRIALSIGSTREMDVHIYEISRNTLTRFTFGGLNSTPVWSPDGKLIAFSRRTRGDTTDIIVKRADGTGADRLLWSWVGDFADVSDWSPDGRTLLLQLGSSNSQNRLGGLRALDVESGRVTDPIPDEFAGESRASFSPDMKYVSFAAATAATANVFVQSMSAEGGFWQVSSGPGWAPRWSGDGRTLYYNDPSARVIMRVPIIPGSTFRFGEPTRVATAFRTPSLDPAFFPFDVFPDGSGFLMVIAATDDYQKEIVVVMNWFEELKKAFGEE